MTGFSPNGRVVYGERFLDTFDRFWPTSVHLQVFVEEPTPIPRNGERPLWSCPGVREFIERHRNNPQHTGQAPVSTWRPKDHEKGYSYRHDSVKFSRQCFIPETAALGIPDEQILAWFDADVITNAAVPEGFIEQLIGKADLCYLGRTNMHTELGFWAVRLNKRTRLFLADLAELWRSDRIFTLPEWHSAFAFDYVLRRSPELRKNNLTPTGRGAVFMTSPLARYLDHLKGNRKLVYH